MLLKPSSYKPAAVLLALLIAALRGAIHAAEAPPSFAGVEEACVDFAEGVPKLVVNGEDTIPFMFFPNTDLPFDYSERFHREQVDLAAEYGVRLYSFPCRIGWEDGEPDYSKAFDRFQLVVERDPKALILPRMFIGPESHWPVWEDLLDTEVMTYSDGSKGPISIASEYFWAYSNKYFAQAIQTLEASPYGKHIIGYHPGGPDSEMFMRSYRSKGPDYSTANQKGFQAYLRGKYATGEALAQAWARPGLTFAEAAVPDFEPGRFPMHSNLDRGDPIRVFYRQPEEQDWIDYSEYASAITADRIIDWARLIKEETDGKKLAAFFYGYTIELCGSFSGHYALKRVLECEDVDILASPISYYGRLGGDPGAYMSLVDTITAHGKLWMNEDDTRTSVVKPEHIRVNLPQGKRAKTLDETVGVLSRNLGAALTHRAGTWWMDLIGAGAFNHPRMWAEMQRRVPLYEEVYRNPSPFRPQVAVIVDEEAKFYIRDDWDVNFQLLKMLRNHSVETGAAVGFYSLDDLLSGGVPPCRAFVFANAFVLNGDEIDTLHKRLDREGALAIWLYGAACAGGDGYDPEGIAKASGIAVEAKPGKQGSQGAGLLAGEEWGISNVVEPRPVVVESEDVEILGRYTADGAPSAARTRMGEHESVFIGDIGVSTSVLRKLYNLGGAHIWADGGEAVYTDGEFLVVHSGTGGTTALYLPGEGVEIEAVDGHALERAAHKVLVELKANETAWFRLNRN